MTPPHPHHWYSSTPAPSVTTEENDGLPGTSWDDPSGHARAQEAHDAGAVELVSTYPVTVANLEFRLHGPADEVRDLLAALTTLLAGHPLVLAPVAMTTKDDPRVAEVSA